MAEEQVDGQGAEEQEPGATAGELAELRKQLASVRSEAAERRIALKEWASLGASPDEIKALLDAQRKATEDDAAKKGNFEKVLEEREKKWSAEINKRDERIKGMESSLDRALRHSEATQAITEAKGSVRLLMPHVVSRTSLEEHEESGYRVVVLDDNGKRRFGPDGEPMTVAELIQEMREDPEFQTAFEGSGASGGGTAGKAGGQSGTGRVKRSAMTSAEKGAYIREHGQAAFLKLPL